jgi:hypothetical protein
MEMNMLLQVLTLIFRPLDFDFASGIFTIRQHLSGGKLWPGIKTGKKPVPSIHKDLVEHLRVMCASNNPNNYLFRNRTKLISWNNLAAEIRRLARKPGLAASPYKVVKHAFVSYVSNKTQSLATGKFLRSIVQK